MEFKQASKQATANAIMQAALFETASGRSRKQTKESDASLEKETSDDPEDP